MNKLKISKTLIMCLIVISQLHETSCKGEKINMPTDDDVSLLLQRIKHPLNDKNKKETVQYLKYHEAITSVRRYSKKNKQLSVILVETAINPNNNPVIRDYAVQHLSEMVVNDSSFGQKIIPVLINITKIKEQTIAGTALRGLCRIADKYPTMISLSWLEVLSLSIIPDEQYNVSARIVAIQILMNTGCKKAIPLIRNIVEKSSSVTLRATAITALGILGDTGDITLLKNIARKDDFFAGLANKSINKIAKR